MQKALSLCVVKEHQRHKIEPRCKNKHTKIVGVALLPHE
jgi:hypothetical protein